MFRVGNLRFAAPQPPVPFSGTRQAASYGAACPQQGVTLLDLGILNLTIPLIPGSAGTSEDCKAILRSARRILYKIA